MKKFFLRLLLITIIILANSCVSGWKSVGDEFTIENGYNDLKYTLKYYDPFSEDQVFRNEIYNEVKFLVMNNFISNDKVFGYFCYKSEKEITNNFNFLHILRIFPIYFLSGAPTDVQNGKITVYLDIFDSMGNLIKKFEVSSNKKQIAGLYYGHDINEENLFKKLNIDLWKSINSCADEINESLELAGPITKENNEKAKKKIHEYYHKEIQQKQLQPTIIYVESSSNESDTTNNKTSTDELVNEIQNFATELNSSINNAINNHYIKCSTCNGSGSCSSCKGSGKLYGAKCYLCNGSGKCNICHGDGNSYN